MMCPQSTIASVSSPGRSGSGPARWKLAGLPGRSYIDAQVTVELRAVVLLDDQHAVDAVERGSEPLRLRRREQPHRDQPDACSPASAARATASRTAAVDEPNVITAASPSPSMSAHQRP